MAANVSELTPVVPAEDAGLDVSTRTGLEVTDTVLPTLSVPVSVYT